ncbi:flagellar biosynthetic protein FliO [Simiduia curdlanivorans]|uniref:FliO/MopB family protein n=1 Tax=Simiduia curdlanivorans TaxID=1492769 RepID=A0ABV8V992_9GAMM|nr:flagellar biosynthetic protein FliO [Simiduia curdlanivorans]MDN3639867.1 flagellar biosynthetic protein FliO [Simiduia curdlanivorans]
MSTELKPIAETTGSLLTAAPTAALKAQTTSDMAVQLIQVLGSLGLVIGLVFLLAYLIKKNQGFSSSVKQLKVIERLALTNKDQLLLVSLHGKEVLLGVSAAGINTLLTFDEEPLAVSEHMTEQGAAQKSTGVDPLKRKQGNFAHHLQQILTTRMAS